MATASNFEGFTSSDAFEASSYTAETTPKLPAAPFVTEAGKGYREIAGNKAVQVNPAAVFATGIIGIAFGVAAGLCLTTGGFAHPTARTVASAPATASHVQSAPVAVAQQQKQPPAISSLPAQSSVSRPAITSAPAVASKPTASLPAAMASSHAGLAKTTIAKPAVAAKPAAFKTAAKSAVHISSASAKTRPAVFLLAKRHSSRFNPDQMFTVPPVQTASAAEAHIPALRPAVMIEGDVTVSDFDDASGRIETREGKSFLLSHAANAFSWDELHTNLHYRCDLAGNCSLSRSGAGAANAKLDL